MFKDYTFFVKCNDYPYMKIHVVAENYDKAFIYAKDMYAANYSVYVDDRENDWQVCPLHKNKR